MTRLFYEAYPQDPSVVFMDGLGNIPFGHTLYIDVTTGFQFGSNGHYWFEDETTGVSVDPLDEPIHGSTGSSAEAILEVLPWVGPLAVWNNGLPITSYVAGANTGGYEGVGSGPHESWHLYNCNYTHEIAAGGDWTDSDYATFPVNRIGNQDTPTCSK